MDDDTAIKDQLKARSLELAERAYRLKERAGDSATTEKLDKVGDTLIEINNANRFYLAQTYLELIGIWAEDRRSLAHEINTEDQTLRKLNAITFEQVHEILETWVRAYTSSTVKTTISFGFTIQKVLAGLDGQNKKEEFDTILEIIEQLLLNSDVVINPSTIDSRILQLRAMRDALLVKRELDVDLGELNEENRAEGDQVARVELARSTLANVYDSMTVVSYKDLATKNEN